MQARRVAVGAAGFALVVGIWIFWPHQEPKDSFVATGESPSAAGADAVGAAGSGGSEGPESERQVLPTTQLASLTAEPYGALRVLATWHDGTPASGVAILFRAQAEPAKERDTLRVTTDASGVALARRLHEGTVALGSDRGGGIGAEVVAGAEREARFEIPEGIDVQGIVVDRDRSPVGGAAIWLTTGEDGWLGGRVVASSRPDGTFVVRSVDRSQSLGALADGWAPSELFYLGDVDPARPIELRLLHRGAAVRGRVTNDAGAPVAGALVAIGHLAPPPLHRHHQTRFDGWSPVVVETDREGRFACLAVAPGTMSITVRADGFALWFARKTCRVSETTHFDVVLSRPATIHGVVTDDHGAPIEGARVLVLDAPFDHWIFEVTQSGNAFGRPTALTDAAGRYKLPFVSPGQARLYTHKGVPASRNRYRGSAEATLQVMPGETVRWDPKISLRLVIRGRLEVAGGAKPQNFWSFQATPEREGLRVLCSFPLEGYRFEFTNCDDVPYTIAADEAGSRSEPIRKFGVRPGGEEVVITVPREERIAPAKVRGRVLDSGRRLASPSALQVRIQREPLTDSTPAVVEGDRFTATGIEPGRYRVAVCSNEDAVHVSEPFELAPGEERDLGTVQTVPGSGIVVRLVCRDGAELCEPSAYIGNATMGRELTWDGKVLRADGVSPGPYSVRMYIEGAFVPQKDVEVVAGETREVEVDVFPGIQVPLELHAPSQADWKRIQLRTIDDRGRIVWMWDVPNQNGPWPLSFPVTAWAGPFTLEAETDNGMRFRRALDLRDPRAEVETIVIVLRR